MIVYYSPWTHRPSVSEREPQGWIMNWMTDRLAAYQFRELESIERLGERIFWTNHFNEWILEIQISKKELPFPSLSHRTLWQVWVRGWAWRLSWLLDRCLAVSGERKGNNEELRGIWKVFRSAAFSAALQQSWSARSDKDLLVFDDLLNSLLLFKCKAFFKQFNSTFFFFIYWSPYFLWH